MRKEPIFSYDPETKTASCILEGYNQVFVGVANCHPDDFDMANEHTGCEIACRRATIQLLQYYKNCVIKPALTALEQLYHSMNMSYRFNPKSYENKMLQRSIRQKKDDLDTVSKLLVDAKAELRAYIMNKEEFYQQIRKNRKANTQ